MGSCGDISKNRTSGSARLMFCSNVSQPPPPIPANPPLKPATLKSSTMRNPPFSPPPPPHPKTPPAKPRPLEVADDEKPALLQVTPRARRFRVGHLPPADLDDVRDRVFEQLGIVQPEAVDLLGARGKIGDLI